MVAASGDTTWITPAVLDGYTSGSAGDVGAILRTMKGMANAVEPDSITNQMHLINVPVWLMLGTAPHEGGISHGKVELMQQRIPNFTIDSVPGSGLHIHEEQPGVVVAEVLKILGKGDQKMAK
jgi:pimeloyl-ACP methyl ester carboxylesterase